MSTRLFFRARRPLARAVLSVLVLATVATVAVPGVAGAEGGVGLSRSGQPTTTAAPRPGQTTTTVPTMPALGATGATTTPVSLTAALLAMQSQASGIDLESFLATKGADLDAAIGAQGVFTADTFAGLNANLVQFSFGGTSGMGFEAMAQNLARAQGTPDALGVAQGIDLARAIGGLPSPALSMPGLGPAGASILSAGPDEMLFGLFANQSLANMVLSAPDLISQVSSTGQLGPEGMAAFNTAVANAGTTLSSSLASGLPNPCAAGMIMSLATGSSQAARAQGVGDECAPCFAAGQYMHSQLGDLFSGTGDYTQSNDGTLTPFEWQSMDPASQQAILSLNPQLQAQIDQVQGNTSAQASSAQACGAASAGATNYLQSNLGSLLGSFGG